MDVCSVKFNNKSFSAYTYSVRVTLETTLNSINMLYLELS